MSSFRIDFDPLVAAADRLDRINGAALTRELVQRVAVVGRQFDAEARRAMNAGIALEDGYISSRMTLEVSDSTPRVEITAEGPGGRKGLTVLGHYSPRVVSAAAKGSARGDPKRGVPPGHRAVGVNVTVRRGQPKYLAGAFTMTLRRGTAAGDQIGVFRRDGKRKVHLYGVSPYSLFRFQVENRIESLRDRVQAAGLAAIDAVVQA